MQKLFRCVVLAGLVTALPAAVSAGDLKLTLANGKVTLVADDVPLRQILAEWARLGKTTVINGDKLVGPPLTLQLIDVPEEQALETLLRSASGYVVAQRASYVADASMYDRILILPTSRAPAASASSAPASFNQPARPMPQPMPDDDDPVDAPVVMPPGMNPGNAPQQLPAPGMLNTTPPTNMTPMTAPRPGLLPGPPGQSNPYVPGQPPTVRPPGGPGGGPGGSGGPGGER
jgi:hypothetical protein